MADRAASPQATEHLQSFIADCDRRTELAKKRLAETQEEISAEVAAKVKPDNLRWGTFLCNTRFHLHIIFILKFHTPAFCAQTSD